LRALDRADSGDRTRELLGPAARTVGELGIDDSAENPNAVRILRRRPLTPELVSPRGHVQRARDPASEAQTAAPSRTAEPLCAAARIRTPSDAVECSSAVNVCRKDSRTTDKGATAGSSIRATASRRAAASPTGNRTLAKRRGSAGACRGESSL